MFLQFGTMQSAARILITCIFACTFILKISNVFLLFFLSKSIFVLYLDDNFVISCVKKMKSLFSSSPFFLDMAMKTSMSAVSSPFSSFGSSVSDSSDEKNRIDKLQEELINVQVSILHTYIHTHLIYVYASEKFIIINFVKLFFAI